MNTISFKNKEYPLFQAQGNASQFAIPFAKHFCIGKGVDIGCNKIEWSYPGSIPIDITFNNGYDATHLPEKDYDYVYSSHCLEHLQDWVGVLDYWTTCLRPGGILFLYLPHYDQEYWRPWNNRKHIHVFTSEIISTYLKHKAYVNVFRSERDLNDSFIVIGEKHG